MTSRRDVTGMIPTPMISSGRKTLRFGGGGSPQSLQQDLNILSTYSLALLCPLFWVQSLFVSDCFGHVRLHAVFSIYIGFGQVNATCVSLPFNLYLARNLFQNAQGLPAADPLSFASTLIYNLFLEHGLANGFLNLCRALF